MADAEITLRDVVAHVQNMERHLIQQMGGIEQRLTVRMDKMEYRMEKGFALVGAQIDMIDRRLDAIEIENLPKRVAVLEAVVLKR